MFVQALANEFNNPLDITKVNQISICPNFSRSEESYANGVVMSVQSFPEAVKGNKVGRIEFERFLGNVNFKCWNARDIHCCSD